MQKSNFKPIQKPFIRKVYNGHTLMIGLPRKLIHLLHIKPEDYVHLFYDEFNNQLIVRKVPDVEDLSK